ncbi:MAG: FapA family protein [Myxococcota bacterium]|nr:FapA family protein [Myxococcota bacterium]
MAIEIRISQDRMRAAALAWPAKERGNLTQDTVYRELKRMEVVHGVLGESIDAFVRGVNTTDILDQPYLQVIAQGTHAIHGTDGRIEWVAEEHRDQVGTVMPGGHIDFRERGCFVEVEANGLVATIIPAKQGIDGKDIFGQIVTAHVPSKVNIKPSTGAKSAANGLEIRAVKAGVLRVEKNQVYIDELIRIRGNVDFSSGNVKGAGSVHITGDVLPGFEVQAAHNILVDGSVEASVVECEGSIVIRQGAFRGSRIYAKEEVSVGHMRDAYAEADGNIIIQREVMNSTINTKRDLIVKDGPSGARITGGITRALGSIQLGHAGSPDGTITRLEAGFDPDLEVRKTRLEIELSQVEERIEQLNRLSKLAAASSSAKPMAATHFKKMLKFHSSERERIETALDKLLEASFTGDLSHNPEIGKVQSSFIHVKNTIYPGVAVRVREGSANIKDETAGGRFWYDRTDDMLKLTA